MQGSSNKKLRRGLIACTLIFVQSPIHADLKYGLNRLQRAYPNFIKEVSINSITWYDGSKMKIVPSPATKSLQEKIEHPTLFDQLETDCYTPGNISSLTTNISPSKEVGRIRYEPFFRKMYGENEQEVKQKLVTLYWMPRVFGNQYPLQVTTVNEVNKKFLAISSELEKLPPKYYKFLRLPAGTFLWRHIADTPRFSMHSFGMTIDLNTEYSNYWLWDLTKATGPLRKDTKLIYHNQIPWEIIRVFEKYNFIWGGKWYHYDTMHFEYRPELFCH